MRVHASSPRYKDAFRAFNLQLSKVFGAQDILERGTLTPFSTELLQPCKTMILSGGRFRIVVLTKPAELVLCRREIAACAQEEGQQGVDATCSGEKQVRKAWHRPSRFSLTASGAAGAAATILLKRGEWAMTFNDQSMRACISRSCSLVPNGQDCA